MGAELGLTHRGRRRAGDFDGNDEFHAGAGLGVDACRDGCGRGRARAGGHDDGRADPVQLQPGHDRECVDAFRYRRDTVVGGDLNGATFFGGGSNVPASPTLYLFGKLKGSLNLNAGGSLYDADASTPHVNYNGGGKHYTTLPAPLVDYTAPLTGLSTELADLTATAGASFVNGKFNAGSNTRRRRVRDYRI